MNLPKVSILCVGTELSTGQILNRNSQWIAQELMKWGIPTQIHLTVPDDRRAILEALEYCGRDCELLFITGGLGPTSDDFTRELIAEWTQSPLEFDQSSWQQVQELLGSRGIQIREMQKQQCYFPKNAKILSNRLGTANGFYQNLNPLKLFCLPGPPLEIEALWNDYIAKELEPFVSQFDPIKVYSVDTIGFGESEIAHRVSQSLSETRLEIGYRVHLPYVEVKLFYRRSQQNYADQQIEKLEKGLIGTIALRNGENAAALAAKKMAGMGRLLVIDKVSKAYLLNRLMPYMRELVEKQQVTFSNEQIEPRHNFDSLLSLTYSQDLVEILSEVRGQQSRELVKTPASLKHMSDRANMYFSELALIRWAQS